MGCRVVLVLHLREGQIECYRLSKNTSVCLHKICKKLKRKNQLHEVCIQSRGMNYACCKVSFMRIEGAVYVVHGDRKAEQGQESLWADHLLGHLHAF